MANDLSAFNAAIWSKLLIKNLDQVNVMLPMTNRNWEGQLNNVGDTVQVRTLGNVIMGSYGKNQTTIQYQDLRPTREPFTISDSDYFAFEVDDIDEIQNDLPTLELYMRRAATSVSNMVEAKILSTYTFANPANQIAGAGGAAITLDSTNSTATGIYQLIVQARANLSNLNAPANERWLVLPPKYTSLILTDTTHFIRSTAFGDNIVTKGTIDGMAPGSGAPGLIGECAGFRIFESTSLPVVNGATFCPYGQGDVISYVAMLKTMETIRLQDRFGTAARGLLLHDATVFQEDAKRLGYIKAA